MLVLLYKGKRERTEYTNYTGIIFFLFAYKNLCGVTGVLVDRIRRVTGVFQVKEEMHFEVIRRTKHEKRNEEYL